MRHVRIANQNAQMLYLSSVRTKYVKREAREDGSQGKRGECRGCLSTIDVNYDHKSARGRGREGSAVRRRVMIVAFEITRPHPPTRSRHRHVRDMFV